MTERREEYGEYSVDWDDQLQPDDTLDYRGVDDVLDEGIVTREGWSPAQGYGNTPAEQHESGGLSHYLEQEEPEPAEGEAEAEEEYVDDDQVGDRRSGRLVADEDGEDLFVHDVGIDGAAASAEEAAVHVIPEVVVEET
ncbi:MAG TPA: DUF5709 domain-containing protein [Marmoricola sp.]|nr:DUF5709 domain-containing protein [Marmoricola sp.]